MQHIQLSKDGPSYSSIAWGVMLWGEWGRNYGPSEMLRLIHEGLEVGLTTYDHADIYGHYQTEAVFGEAMFLQPGLRQRLQLISKCGICLPTSRRPHFLLKHYNTTRDYILKSVHESLRNLKTDYLDLFLIHRPDPLMNPDEVAQALQELVQSGKVREVGVSNFSPSQFSLLGSRIQLVTNQVQASLTHPVPMFDGTFDQLRQFGIRPMAWAPLGEGVFTQPAPNEAVARIHACLEMLSKKYEATADQLLLAWLMRHPSAPIPVIGTGRADRMQAAVAALDLVLDRQDWFLLLQAAMGQEVP
ncbi:MAG: aldo/keto reductase [Bacteroidota bacterium]